MSVTRRDFVLGSAVALCAVTVACRGSRRRPQDMREATQVFPATPSRDGAGVSLRRALGARALPMLDPFLLLDEIHSNEPNDWIAGFPSHPHRGFETVSYLIHGAFVHRDSVGNHGRIADGGVQWMTAGSGIVHSEMPQQKPGLDLWGLQLWINLPAAQKMIAPRYQDLVASDIVELQVGDAQVRLVAGSVGAKIGPVDGVAVAPTLLDAALEAGAKFFHRVPAGHTAFAYVLDGRVQFGQRGRSVVAGQLAVLTGGDHVAATSDRGGRFLLFAAAPIGEPVARRGPFVMNTQRELRQAFEDYRSGNLVR